MKNKPIRHKEANVFRFKPFSERVSEIDVDIFHRVAHRNEDDADEEVETYFHETLVKWNVLNLTDGYTTFRRQVRDIVTLPQLLHRKQHVIDMLMLYLRKRDPLFLQPILELVIAVARDLQKEFYDYFPDFLSEIISLLQTKDAEQVEYTFTTLAYLFKFLWRYLTRNVETVVPLLLPLLSDTQPEYVNRFAAESFAFVVRKIKDKDSFLKLVLRILEDRHENDKENGISGCGKLLFEVISGTPGQFHSCGEQMLLLYFNALQDESVDQRLTYEVLREIVTCILQNVHPQKCDIMWNVILKVMDTFVERSKQLPESNIKTHALVLLLRLVHVVISCKNGRFLTDAVPLTKRCTVVMDALNEDKSILQEVINVSVAILLASSVKLMQETSSQLLLKIMTVNDTELLYSSVENLIHYSSFETLVLPHVLRRSISTGLSNRTLLLLAKVILAKASPCLSGITLDKWKKYILDVRNIGMDSSGYLLLELKTLATDAVSLDALRILVILPHLKPLREEFRNTLKDGLLFLYKKLLKHDDTGDAADINKPAFVFLLTLESLIHVSEPSDLHEFFVKSDIKIIDLVNERHDNRYILNAIDLCMTYFAASQHHADYINLASFDKLNDSLVKKFSSPYGNVRLTVSHLYSLFSNVEALKRPSASDDGKSAMELVYLAERESVTIQSYRGKLLHLQALGFQSYALANLDPRYHEFPLRCVVGNLYVNFSLLWQPVSAIVASYSNKECPQFWPTFLAELTSNNVPEAEPRSSFNCHVISSLEMRIARHDDKPDFENYRILLWKCMAHFSHYAETKNRDLTGLFIDFVNANFFRSNSDEGKCCDVEKRKELIDADNDMDDEKDENEERDEGEVKVAQADAMRRNCKVKLLLAQMEIFDKVQNPRMMHREAEMRQIYLDLISSRNADIQRAALNCLFAYKYKYLLPYKESLYGLINEKNFKNELARFKLDRESNMIVEEHRENLMPIIMRIIYAKMIAKTGMRTGGKAGGFARRKIILRFLGGAQEDEMIIFIKMAFRPLRSYVLLEADEAFDLRKYVENIVDTIDLNNVMPPKRMQSAVNLLAIVIEEFGGKMSTKLLPRLLRILICILAETNGILRRSAEVHPGYLTTIKTVRTSCVGILARFFTHFEDYDWRRHEIDAVYHVAIFPLLQKLPVEGIHSPTALLKLFMAWGQNSRYYPLFAKHQEDDESVTPLPYIMQLLSNPKTHQSVVNAILEIIEKMLTLQDYGKLNEDAMQVDTPFLPLTPILTNTLEVEEKVLSSGVNYGSAVLLPHVPRVLEFIRGRLQRSNRNINRTELTILSRISEFVTDAETCDTVLKLIIPVLIRRATSGGNEEAVTGLLTTVTNLVKIVNRPETHARSIAPLIGLVSDVPARKTLLQVYRTVAEKSVEDDREAMTCYKILAMLNAWDHRWIDQPDFQERLNAFELIGDMARRNAIPLEFGVTVIHNCFYFLKTESDLAMRDSSGECLKLVAEALAREHQSNVLNRRYLMDDTILALTRKGIASKKEAVYLQSISLLGHMALKCADVHPVLRDLSLLVNEADPEVDFFENMRHLQLYRRARALLKFCTLAKTSRKPFNPKTLTQFILPLCSSYLCNETFIHKNSLVDAAIETVGVVCRLLPWHHYEIILKYYLGKLRTSTEFQRQVIRIVVTILDSFHYDLSKYKPVEKITRTEATSTVTEDNAALVAETEEAKEAIGEDENCESTEQGDEEKLEEALNDENVEGIEEIMEKDKEEVIKEDLPVIERQTLLSQYGAKRVVFSISKGLLPQLHRAIVARTRQESSHKVNKKKIASETEEDDLLRVPIALALVKLLQKMPENLLDANLPGIFMKLCTFLKSRLESVRRSTRETLQKIMITLGPKYLHHLLKEMNTLLTKGFQVHVLVYTIQAVLFALKPYYQKRDINNNLQSILSVCKVDLFGLTAEEKEVAGIVKNVSEARSTKSFDIFHILAEFITESCLLDLILPLKEVLMKTHSHKTIHKIVECLRNVTLGLADNAYIPLEQMLVFLYGIISESIPSLMPEKEGKNLAEEERRKETRGALTQRSNYFLVPPEPKNRMGIKVSAKTTKHANAHVMIEFGLKLHHILLKRDKVAGVEYKRYLEPFVSVLSDCLRSHHVKLCTVALQCLNWMLKMDLESMRAAISDICTSMFGILHKYAAAGLSKGDNFDLVTATFKCMSVVVRDVKYFSIDADQLKILLLYTEQDLHDSEKHATAFTLLKAIIHRKMIIAEMHAVMEKVAMLSVTSELEHVKLQSRSVFYSYLMGYPLGKHLNKHIYFYLTQLSYETQPGRLSALEMIHTIVTGFPLKTLATRAEMIFLMTGARLIDDDDPTCRKLCAKCIKEILTRISSNDRNKLFDKWPIQWLSDSTIRYRTLAAQLCGIFVTVEQNDFDSRLPQLLPLLLKQFYNHFSVSDTVEFSKYPMLPNAKPNDPNSKDERTKDHHIIQVLQLLLKIARYTSFLTNEKYKNSIDCFAEYCQSLLAHPHLWARLAAAQMIGFVLAALDVDKVVELLNNPESDGVHEGYLYSRPGETLKSLILDLVAQFYPDMTFEQLADQVVKNLIFIAKMLNSVEASAAKDDEQDDKNKAANSNKLSLLWLIRRLRKAVNIEITQAPKSTSVRTATFKFIAGIVTTVPIKNLNAILFNIMSQLVREMATTEETNAELRRLAKEVAAMIKKSIGNTEYVKLLNRVQQKLDIKKAERRKVRAQQFVTDPDLAAKRKLGKQQKKKEAKKRKMETIKGNKTVKKRKKKIELDDL